MCNITFFRESRKLQIATFHVKFKLETPFKILIYLIILTSNVPFSLYISFSKL